MKRFCVAALAALVWIGTGAVAHALPETREVEEREIGGWTLQAMVGKDDSSFEYCSVGRLFDGGVRLTFVLDRRHSLGMVASAPSWRFDRQDQLSLAIDNGAGYRLKSGRVRDSEITAILSDEAAVLSELRRGRELRFVSVPGDIRIRLAGSARALDALNDCARRHGAPKAGDAASPAPARRSEAQEAAYAATWFTTKIVPEIPEMRVADAAAAKSLVGDIKGLVQLWFLHRSIGMLTVLKADGTTFEMMEAVINSLGRDQCKGTFVPGSLGWYGRIGRIVGSCDGKYQLHMLFNSAGGFLYWILQQRVSIDDLPPLAADLRMAIERHWP